MKKVGVVGSGTMGIEIAQTIAEHHYHVVLYDLSDEIVKQSIERLYERQEKKRDRGRYREDLLQLIKDNIKGTSKLEDMHDCTIVIEAVPESLSLKQNIFLKLEEICRPEAILATNTSSLSITAISGTMATSNRVIGCHFFNPASVMKLVEVIPGSKTDEITKQNMISFIQTIEKEPIEVKDTPGFIVNRVARSFYGEALRIVDEGTATIETVDFLAKSETGFPMGPFELMDFIGIDVNFAVTTSVYEASFQEPRFKPHLIQQRMVEAGLLGRKTGRGFYQYGDGNNQGKTETPSERPSSRLKEHSHSFMIGDGLFSTNWLNRLIDEHHEQIAILWERPLEAWNQSQLEARLKKIAQEADKLKEVDFVWFVTDSDKDVSRKLLQLIDILVPAEKIIFVSNLSVSVTEQASWCQHPERLFGFGGVFSNDSNAAIEITKAMQASEKYEKKIENLLDERSIAFSWVNDGVGLVMPRIVAMIINEAAVALTENIATAEAIDKAMKLGTRYPKGPLEWADSIGITRIYRILQGMYEEWGDDRYRPAPLLKKMMLAEKRFYA